MASMTDPRLLALTGSIGSGIFTGPSEQHLLREAGQADFHCAGILLGFGVMQVPVISTDRLKFSGQQRYTLWRTSFQKGADAGKFDRQTPYSSRPDGLIAVTSTIFPPTLLLSWATYCCPVGPARTLLGCATASLLSVFLITPAVMLGAGLRADILNTAKEEEHEEGLKVVVARFNVFHSVRIVLAAAAAVLSACAVWQL